MTMSSLPLVETTPALPRNSMLFGAVIVQVLSPPVVLATPLPVYIRLDAVATSHWFSAGP